MILGRYWMELEQLFKKSIENWIWTNITLIWDANSWNHVLVVWVDVYTDILPKVGVGVRFIFIFYMDGADMRKDQISL